VGPAVAARLCQPATTCEVTKPEID
jgi:hypothetical protein